MNPLVQKQAQEVTCAPSQDTPSFPRNKTVVLYDGSCPLCRAEIDWYFDLDSAKALHLVDVSKADAPLPRDLDPKAAMARFHLVTPKGHVLSGARAFVDVWRHLPGWRWAARIASLPGAVVIMELVYKTFLRIRPMIVGIFVMTRRHKSER